MRVWKKMRLRMRSLFDRRAVEQELDAQLQFHVEVQIEENRAVGMSNEEVPATPPFASLELLPNSQRSAGTCEV